MPLTLRQRYLAGTGGGEMTESCLLLAQVDDVTGEVLGRAGDDLMALGARNVQLLSGLSKKGRPAYVLLVDTTQEKVVSVGSYLALELGVWGYHVIPTEHRHMSVAFREVTVHLLGKKDERRLLCRVKEVRDGEKLVGLKVEHDFICHLQERLRQEGVECSLRALRVALESRLWEEASAIRLSVSGGRLIVSSELQPLHPG